MIGIKTRRDDFGIHKSFVIAQCALRQSHQHGAAHLPTRHQIACQHQVRHTARIHVIGIGFGLTRHKMNDI